MTMTPEQQRDIIARESAWIDADQFAPLDLSAFPALNEPRPDQYRDYGRFAKHWSDTPFSAGANELRNFVANPDHETLQRVADETNDPGLLRDVRDRRGERVAAEFKQRCPGYLPTDSNYAAIVTTLAYNTLSTSEQNADTEDLVDLLISRGYWTATNLQAIYEALEREGILDVAAGEPRNLTERERLRVARLAQAGRIDEAIGEYLRCALDGDEPGMDMINDPKYRSLCNDSVYEVFQNIQLDYVETPSRKAYLLRFAGTRPLTVRLLQEGWKSLQAQEQRRERGELFRQIGPQSQPLPVTEAQIDWLDDSAVDRLYHDSLRAYADSIRGRAPGVIA